MFKRVLISTKRDVLWVELLAALQTPACAFCHLAEQKSRRYVETLLNEAVADVDHRDIWRAARGLCAWHAQMALGIPHSAGSLALLYDDLLRHDLTQVVALASASLTTRRWPWRRSLLQRLRRWLQQWQQPSICQVCTLWQAHEQLYRAVLLDAWTTPEMSQGFAASPGLCWPHLLRLAEQNLTHPNLPAALAAQHACLLPLQHDLQEFIRKLDYRFARQPYGREADAWQRVVRLYSGRAVVYDSQPPHLDGQRARHGDETR